MRRLRDLDLARHLADPALKPQFVTPMFDLVAPRYDRFTRLFSFGMDARWKRSLLEHVFDQVPAPRTALDLACGTGDLALAVASRCPATHVTGLDAAREMLVVARARAATTPPGVAARVTFREGDLAALPAADASVDLMTVGYGFRNAQLAPALAECARVARPGAVLAVLDFYRPESALWRSLFLAYLGVAGRLVGWWWHREPVAYGYIAPSIAGYVSVREFADAAAAAGFDTVAIERHLGGGVAVHAFRRRA